MKSIKGWSDWYIHPFTLIYLIAAWLNDNLFAYLSALFIVCTHEFGHYYFAKKFNFEIEKVEIFPFGAFLSLNDYGTHHIIEELVIVMAGLSTHLGMFLVFSLFKDYYRAVKLQIKVSIFSLSVLIVLYNQMGYILVYFYLLYINYQYIKEFRYIIIRLYLKRMHDNQYHRLKINHDYRFYRPYENYYLIGGNGYSEKEVLQYLIKNLKSN